MDLMRSANNNGKEWSDKTMEVLCGGDVPKKVPELLAVIASTIDDPRILTRNVERIATDPDIKKYRFHLVRMQIHSELNMREDVDRHTMRLYVSQTLERLAFGDLKLEGTDKHGSDED